MRKSPIGVRFGALFLMKIVNFLENRPNILLHHPYCAVQFLVSAQKLCAGSGVSVCGFLQDPSTASTDPDLSKI
jgi:hypothetical protein